MPVGVAFRSLMAAGAGGAAAPWDVIDSTTLGSAAASISFATGLSGYKLFRVTAYIVKDGSNGLGVLRFNNDSGANYSYQRLLGAGTGVLAQRSTGQTSYDFAAGAGLKSNDPSTLSAVIAKQVTGSPAMVLSDCVIDEDGTALYNVNVAGIWSNTADLISRIDLVSSSGNFDTGTVAVLEGVPD